MTRNNYLWKIYSFKIQGCGVDITARALFCSGIFGAIIVLSVLGFTLSNIGYKFPIGGSEVVRVCASGGISEGGFCVELFILSEMGDTLPNYADKLTIDGIDKYIDKEEGISTRS